MSTSFSAEHWPVEIRLRREDKALDVTFDDGTTFSYSAEFLRVESPSAEVQGHGPSQKKVIAGRRHVGIISVTAVGNYAVKISFDDLHDTGIYSWQYLYEIGADYETIWQAYLGALADRSLSRDP